MRDKRKATPKYKLNKSLPDHRKHGRAKKVARLKARIDTFFSKAEWDNPDKIP